MADRDWFTPAEAAALCKVTSRTMQRWCDRGDVDCGRTPGGFRRIPPAEVARLRAQLGLPALDYLPSVALVLTRQSRARK
jgi:hypothetical protein